MKTEHTRRYKFFLVITLLITLGQTASAATIALKVESIKGSGASVEVPIAMSESGGLGALQFDLTYDPTIVNPKSVENGIAMINGMVEFKVKSPGLLGIAFISSEPVYGSGELLKVRFKPVAKKAGNTILTITEESAWDFENNLEMLVTTEDGFLSWAPELPKTEPAPKSGFDTRLVIGSIVLLVVILIIVLA